MPRKRKVPKNLRATSAFKKMKLRRAVQQKDKNGNYINKATLRKRASIQELFNILSEQGIMVQDGSVLTTQAMSEEALFAIGYTVEEDGADFTLVDSQTPTKKPGQLSIGQDIARDYAPIRNFDISTESMVSSFPSHFNPIFIADEQEPRTLQKSTQQTFNNEMYEHLDLVDTAVRCASMGLRNTKRIKSSKYFDNNQVRIGLNARRTS